MSSICRIKILDKSPTTLTFRVYSFYPIYNSMPRTHGFAYLLLADVYGSKVDRPTHENFVGDVYENGRRYIKSFTVDGFVNIPSPDNFHEALDTFDEFTEEAEAMMPQATYTMNVYDGAVLEGINTGDQWDSAMWDMWGASWYMEKKSEKSPKFYHVYKDERGNWQRRYGKVSTVGRGDSTYYANEGTVEKYVVGEKLRPSKGYKLIYKNFDTEYDLELKTRSEKNLYGVTVMEAVKNNDVTTVKKALANGFKPNDYRSENDLYLLEECFFVRFGNDDLHDVVEVLFQYGYDPNLNRYESYFHNVVETCAIETVQLFLTSGIEIENEDHGKLFCAAVNAGNVEFIKMMLDKGFDPNSYPSDHYSTDANCLQSLSYAKKNQKEVIDLLISTGLDLNAYNKNNESILTSVITSAPLSVIEYLIEKGANTTHKTRGNHTLLEACAYYGEVDVFKYFAQSGDKVELAKAASLVIERLTVLPNHVIPKMQILLDLGITFDYLYQNKEWDTNPSSALDVAFAKKKSVKKDELVAVMQLLEWGLDPHKRLLEQDNLAWLAIQLKSVDLFNYCREKGVDISGKSTYYLSKGSFTYTIQEYAAKCKAKKILEQLD